MWYEAMIEVDHSYEPFESFDMVWSSIFVDGLVLARKWLNAIFIDRVPKEINFGQPKRHFLSLITKPCS